MTIKSKHNSTKIDPALQQRTNLVFQKIEIWKKHLLDLTRRNRLLFFTPSRTSTIQITSPSPDEVFQRLVINERTLTFPIPKRERQLVLEGIVTAETKNAQKEDFKPGDLETSSPAPELQNKLYRLRREWKTWQEEQGVHTLFLTLGMLHWQESEHEQQECLAPIILVPVGIDKEGWEKPYTIYFVDEDIVINPALAYKLEIDHGIDIPELPEEPEWVQIDQILKKVAKRIPEGWDVTDELWLGRFSFEKFVMYRDLEEHKKDAVSQPIIAALAHATPLPIPAEIPGTEDMDKSVDPKEVFPILDADSSQLEVLVRTRAGQNLVVQGPPGTGKSQTIVNLVAQALRDHKKVLFVSEKMAALEVVFRRLKETGLSFACLEIHSHRSNKAKVIEELGRTLQKHFSTNEPLDSTDKFSRLVRRRELLNRYVKELHKPRGALSITAYKAHGHLSNYWNAATINFNLQLERAQDTTADNLDEWRTAIRRLSEIPEVWDNYATHPWAGANIDIALYTIEQRDQLVEVINKLRRTIQQIETISTSVASRLNLRKIACLDDCEKLLEILKVLRDCVPVAETWLQMDATGIGKLMAQATEAEEHAIRLSKGIKILSTRFRESILALPVDAMLTRFRERYRSIFRWAYQKYREDIKSLKAHWVSDHKIRYRTALDGLKAASLIISERVWFRENGSRMLEAFGDFYKGNESDWDAIILGIKWAKHLITILPEQRVPKELIQLALHPSDLRFAVEQPLAELTVLFESTIKPCEELGRIYQSSMIQGYEIRKTPFDALGPWLNCKTNAKDLDDWVTFLRTKGSCENLGLGEFMKAAIEAGVKANQLENAFCKKFWRAWVSEAHRDAPSLNEFRMQRHDDIIKEFRILDTELKQVTVGLIQHEIQKQQPKRSGARAETSQVGILLREVQKRRRHRPLRRLFAEIPELLQALKPCLLMSPLSVAAYLGNSTCRFDLLIFDEASQIPPEDAIGAILRTTQLVVAGDNKQLPPTKFFQADIDPEEEEEVSDEAPLESILDECAALPTGFSASPLKWHYRSRYEELISFSNKYFYENSLVTFPSPYPTGSSGSVRFVHIPEGLYDRGGSRTNRIEAQKVIDLVAEHLRSGKGGSVGIITLSLAQEEAIVQEWERRKAVEPDLAKLVGEEGDEPFFIKALEKVQGDERDFIFISIGYGPDQNRVISMNFGPINKAGGERRLNVAITRARHQNTVVTSILPHELDLTRLTTGNMGVFALQGYLDYAYNGGIIPEKAKGPGIPESDFEIAVKEALEFRGYQVDSQVGFSGFRIDLGIRHPDFPTQYILGVECDGATYHSHRTARDRDRLRQEVLTQLGWQIHRIWSTDWIRDPDTALNLVIKRVNDLKMQGVIRISAPESTKKSNPDTERPGSNPSGNSSVKKSNMAHIPLYKQYVPAKKKPSEWLYRAENSSNLREGLFEDIVATVNQEGPIHLQALCSRICEIYGLQKVGGRIEKIIEGVLEDSTYRKHFVRRGDFMYPSGNRKFKPRGPQPGEKARPIEWIAIEELASAAEWLLKEEFGMPREALIRETARIMGFERTGVNVQTRLDEAIDFLLREGRVKESGGQISQNKH
jgi:very-short-patch-repair endonuclease